MLWTALVPLTVLCLAGLVRGDDDSDSIYWFPGRRKLASLQNNPYDNVYNNQPKTEYLDDYVDDYSKFPDCELNLSNSEIQIPDYQRGNANTDCNRRQETNIFENVNPFLNNHLTHTKLRLYNRNQNTQIIKASDWFKNFDPHKDLVILVHGYKFTDNYPDTFFDTIGYALLQNSDYNVIAIDWRHFIQNEKDNLRVIEEAVKIGHLLNTVVERALNAEYSTHVPRTIYIGQGVGCVPVIIQSINYGYKFDSVFGLNPRSKLENYLILTQSHGHLVQTLSVNPYPYSLAHRDYRPIFPKDFQYDGDNSDLCYQLMATAIMHSNMTARFCSDEESYIQGHCSRLPEVSIWQGLSSHKCGRPTGIYFFELPSPRLKSD